MIENYFDEPVAARYDESVKEMFDPDVVEPAVDVLAELAGDGAVLEFGIGTGRIALPLARRGLRVHGIDLSEAMIRRLRAKPGAESLEVTVGDFSSTTVTGSFRVVYLVFNTIGNLTTQAAQVECFQNAAHHLEPGGYFVIETGIPQLRRLPPGETRMPLYANETRWGFDEFQVATQHLTSHHFELVDGNLHQESIPFRYVWPSELDLMAAMAGMELRDRWGDWDRQPFTDESDKHVSIWCKKFG